jgi:hypothetical protein
LCVTFGNMGDGVAMFDGELRLAVWNLNSSASSSCPARWWRNVFPMPTIRFLARRPAAASSAIDDIEAELSRRLEGLGAMRQQDLAWIGDPEPGASARDDRAAADSRMAARIRLGSTAPQIGFGCGLSTFINLW